MGLPKCKILERRYTFLIANIKIKHKIRLLKIWQKIRFGLYFKYNTLIDINLWNYNIIIIIIIIITAIYLFMYLFIYLFIFIPQSSSS